MAPHTRPHACTAHPADSALLPVRKCAKAKQLVPAPTCSALHEPLSGLRMDRRPSSLCLLELHKLWQAPPPPPAAGRRRRCRGPVLPFMALLRLLAADAVRFNAVAALWNRFTRGGNQAWLTQGMKGVHNPARNCWRTASSVGAAPLAPRAHSSCGGRAKGARRPAARCCHSRRACCASCRAGRTAAAGVGEDGLQSAQAALLLLLEAAIQHIHLARHLFEGREVGRGVDRCMEQPAQGG